ncbi:MAG: 4Fe-4S binding protein [Desulfovibrio sp.]|jgi:MauM/NapG family ferredoxin protein|nr:4Fe-4S binding protein [Desulfovibrio sp.]
MMKRAALRQRLIQACSLSFFLYLLGSAVWTEAESLIPRDLYLRLDPLAALLIPPAARAWLPALLPGAALIVCAPVIGRIFCGYICPMGATLDLGCFIGRRIAGDIGKDAGRIYLQPYLNRVKYLLLAAMLTAAFAGVNLVYWGSPISLVTRFWGLVMHPFASAAADLGLDAGRPLFESLGFTALLYLDFEPRRFDGIYFTLGFFLLLFILEQSRPRFWCRYLCPAGAILGLASLRPALRRGVDGCNACGVCARSCPGGAIVPEAAFRTRHSECLTCMNCVDVCPRKATSFSFFPPEAQNTAPGKRATEGVTGTAGTKEAKESCAPPLPSRRAFLGAGAAGIVTAAAQYSGASSLLGSTGRGSLWTADLLRPPGALPETDFQRRCIRCGECMKICPGNALQPAWFQAGVEGMFSPVFVPRRGPCEPDCTACGRVCPTGAIRSLIREEKYRAKIGTAAVNRSRCVAWAEKKRCVVCEETCPFASIALVRVPGSDIPAPVVDPLRCFGCGYCENYCVTRVPAVTVEPLNSLRMVSGSYRETAEQLGLKLNPWAENEEAAPADSGGDLPPGFLPLEPDKTDQ